MSAHSSLVRLAWVAVLTAALAVGLAALGARFYAGGSGAKELVRRGEEVFWGRGRCASCHPIDGQGGGVRCPDLGRDAAGPFAVRAGRRVPGLDAIAYLAQSMADPEAFVVPGYPSRLMPPVLDPPVALSEEDVVALVTFLHPDAAGRGEVVMQVQAALHRRPARRAAASRRGDPTRGRIVYDRMKCGVCHVLAGVSPPGEAEIARWRGPELTGIGAIQTEEYLTESVWSPNTVVVPGPAGEWLARDGHTSVMPSYRESMSENELRDLVAFLSIQR